MPLLIPMATDTQSWEAAVSRARAGRLPRMVGRVDFDLDDGRAVLGRTPKALRALLSGLPDGWSSGDEGPGTWSPYQVVGHLTHVEEVDWIDRTRVILEHGTDRVFEPVDREAGFTRFAGWPLDELLDRFGALRDGNLRALEELVRPEDLGRRGVHPTFGEVTLAQLLATWVVHDLNHLGQIVKAEAKQYRNAVGPWRDFLPIVEAP
jgi:DinB superfamily